MLYNNYKFKRGSEYHLYACREEIITTAEHPFYVPKRGWTAAIELRAGDVLVNVNGEYVILEKIEHELLESPVKVYNFEVEDFHTYYVGDSGVLVHNKCINTEITTTRKEGIKYGKEFLGEGYTKVGKGRYQSADGYRTMRFDLSHHNGYGTHLNLETWKHPVRPSVRNKLLSNIHVFFE